MNNFYLLLQSNTETMYALSSLLASTSLFQTSAAMKILFFFTNRFQNLHHSQPTVWTEIKTSRSF